MQPLSCIIVDDEPIARNILQEFIQKDERLVLEGSYATASDALRELHLRKSRLLFLDIKMPGISGFEMLRSLPYQPYVIFTTAYREYAVEGFDLNGVDYLLKPFAFDRFLLAVNKVWVLYTAEEGVSNYKTESDGHIFVKSNGKLVRVNIFDICYIEALKEYVRIVTKEEQYIIYQSMQHLEEKLPADLFYRIHRSYIVGLNHINAIEGNTVLVNHATLPISRYIKDQFLENIRGKML